MSSPYNGANAFPVTITIPSDGDLADAISVNAALEALADRTVNLQNFINGVNPGPVLLNPTLIGTLSIAGGALIGDGTFLNIGQPGESTRFLGPTVFSALNTHRVDGLFVVAVGGHAQIAVGSSITIDGSETMNGTQDVFGKIVLHNPGYIQFRVFAGTPTPASQTFSIQNGDEFFFDPVTSNMIITIADPVSDGLRIRFSVINATNTANQVNLARSDASGLVPFGSSSGGLRWSNNYIVWIDIVSRGGRWEPSAYGKF